MSPVESQLWDHDYRPPERPLPRGSWDCHFHIFGSSAEYPLREGRGYTPFPMAFDAYVTELKAQHKALGIEHGVLAHPGDAYGTNNQSSARALATLGPGYRGTALIDLSFTAADFRRLSAAGFNGFRLNLDAQGNIGLEGVRQLRPELEAAGWHVEIMCHAHSINVIESQLMELGLDIVMEHCAFPVPSEGLDYPGIKAMRRLLASGCIHVKLSSAFRFSEEAPPHADTDPIVSAFISDNPDYVIWGSDWPYIAYAKPMPNPADHLDTLLKVAGSETNFRKIMVDNPRRLHRL